MRHIPFALLTAGLMLTATHTPAQDVKHLTHSEAVRLAIVKPQPTYPPMARQLRLEGKVEIEASVAPDGSVASARPVSGNLVLTGAAVEAAKHWKFPAMAGGSLATLDFVFKQ